MRGRGGNHLEIYITLNNTYLPRETWLVLRDSRGRKGHRLGELGGEMVMAEAAKMNRG